MYERAPKSERSWKKNYHISSEEWSDVNGISVSCGTSSAGCTVEILKCMTHCAKKNIFHTSNT
jgi:hypothetical protein